MGGTRARAGGLWDLTFPAVVGAAVSLVVAGGLLVSPASPLVTGASEASIGLGEGDAAARTLMKVGRTAPDVPTRVAALERAAQVYSLELDDPAKARDALTLVLAQSPSPVEQTRLRERIARLLLRERDVAGAAQQFKRAWMVEKNRPALLARAGELQASIGQFQRARANYRLLAAEAPDWAGRAHLALGEMALVEGRATAGLRPFQQAIKAGSDDVADAARLGLAACYERLGELEGALAEIERMDLPVPVRERRTAGLRQRADEYAN